MSKSRQIRIVGIPRMIVVGLFFAVFSLMGGYAPLPLTKYPIIVPDAYRVPKIPGGTALRLAMVHDVLHERYLRHGDAWYRQRNIDAQKILDADAAIQSPTDRYLSAMDDLAVGLERLGQYEPAIALMRKKLEILSPLPPGPTTEPGDDLLDPERLDLERIVKAQSMTPREHQQYSARANLGTILLIESLPKALAGDEAAKARMKESLQWIEQALAINAAGHFGRETWQAIAIEALLADIDHPDLLGKYDLIGDLLDHATDTDSYQGLRFPRVSKPPANDAEIEESERLSYRRWITRTGIDSDWQKVVHSDYPASMPFDEPTLAIIGMWTMGGGPNPHFALALSQIMNNVGQWTIAWNACERAVELQETFWPEADIRAAMVKQCRDLQSSIAIKESKDNPDAWQTKMRQQHQAELAWGISYQNAYHDFEARQIAAGVPLDDPNFYAAFFKNRAPIASNPGRADDLLVTHTKATSISDALPSAVLAMGLGMLIALVLPEKHLS